VPPDWITVNAKYKKIFDLFDGEHTEEQIQILVRSKYKDEEKILIPQINNFIRTSNILQHNFDNLSQREKNTQISNVSPKYIYLTLTDNCNLKCKYCYTTERKKYKDIEIDKWEKYIDQVLSISQNCIFIFTGGEPLLTPYVLQLAEMTKRNNCENILLTNGTQIDTKEKAKKISELFSVIKISLDSLNEDISNDLRGAGIIKKVQNAFELLNSFGANVLILATVTSLTKNDLEKFSRHFNNQVNFQPFYEMGRGRKNSILSITGTEYYSALTKTDIFKLLPGFHRNIHSYKNKPFKRCAMAKEEISIDSNGNVFPCHMLHYDDLNCGNLNIQSFKEIYYSSPVLKDLRKITVDQINQCRDCIFRNICGGACRARVDIMKNGIKGFNEFCDFEKKAILDALLYSFG